MNFKPQVPLKTESKEIIFSEAEIESASDLMTCQEYPSSSSVTHSSNCQQMESNHKLLKEMKDLLIQKPDSLDQQILTKFEEIAREVHDDGEECKSLYIDLVTKTEADFPLLKQNIINAIEHGYNEFYHTISIGLIAFNLGAASYNNSKISEIASRSRDVAVEVKQSLYLQNEFNKRAIEDLTKFNTRLASITELMSSIDIEMLLASAPSNPATSSSTPSVTSSSEKDSLAEEFMTFGPGNTYTCAFGTLIIMEDGNGVFCPSEETGVILRTFVDTGIEGEVFENVLNRDLKGLIRFLNNNSDIVSAFNFKSVKEKKSFIKKIYKTVKKQPDQWVVNTLNTN